MIARLLLLAAVLLTALLFDTVVFPFLAVWGVRPDIVAVTVVALALVDGPGTGARYGFVAGLASDVLSGGALPVGVRALVLLLLGYTIGAARPYLGATTTAGRIAVSGVAAGVALGAHGLIGLLLDYAAASPAGLARAVVGTAVYSGLVAPLVLRPVATLWRGLTSDPVIGSTASSDRGFPRA